MGGPHIRLASAFFMVLASTLIVHARGDSHPEDHFPGGSYHDQMRRMQALKQSLTRRSLASMVPSPSPSPSSPPPRPPSQEQNAAGARVCRVTSYGADPAGQSDSTDAILRAMSDAYGGPSHGVLMDGIKNLGGARIDLEGGNYLISRPLRFPADGAGNVMIHGGTLRASDDFPTDGYLIDLSSSSSELPYVYEFITLKDLLFDCNYRGGAISVIKSLRTNIDNCYIARFGDTNGIFVQSGHETYIRNTFLGQHVTAGGDKGERSFSGTGITLMGNDNAVTDTVIFSAGTGIVLAGQANILSGVHCYNKATGFGGTGIYIKLPGLTQTRIVNSYLDYTGIVAEDPVQLQISGSFFLGDAYILLKSIKGRVKGLNIVDNMFSGSDKGVDIVQLDEGNGPFNKVEQVVVDRNVANGMRVKSTVGRGSAQGNGSSWKVDLSGVLLFPNRIKQVQYSLATDGGDAFPSHLIRNVSENQVVVESDVALPAATVFVTVDQGY